MLEVGGNLDLTQKPQGPNRCSQLRAKNLDSNVSIMLEIAGKKDKGHPAAADFTVDRVASLEGRTEAAEDIVQSATRGLDGGDNVQRGVQVR